MGRASSAIGLIFAAIFMVVLGYFLTLDVYRYEGPYVIFYAGRYYGGIACMIVGGILFLAGIFLPILWPSPKKRRQSGKEMEQPPLRSKAPSVPSTTRSVELKIRGVSMLSTCGAESMQVLRLLAQQEGTKRCDLSEIINKTGIDDTKIRKVISILTDFDLIERSDLTGEEGYCIAQDIEKEVLEGIKKVDILHENVMRK